MDLPELNVAVIGGGIGGVASAIAFARRGAHVNVFEQAEALAEVGAVLQISANGMAVLRALGVVGDVPPTAVRSTGTDLRDYRSGRQISHVLPPKAGSTWYFHRADLLDLLVEAALKLGVTFNMGRKIDGADPVTGQIGADAQGFDLVVAADGGQSRVRFRLNGPSRPRFSKQAAWRAVVPWAGAGNSTSAVLTMAPGRHVVSYPVRNGTLMNVVGIEERDDWTEEGWKLRGDPDDFRTRFSDFGGAVGDLLKQVNEVYLWALYLHPVADRWYGGRLALLGDAAHPTLPFMAQGACLALEDAWTIAACVDAADTLDDGLLRYQALRQSRAARIVAAAAGNARKFHLSPPASWVAQAALKVTGSALARRYDWIYSYDATQA